MTDEVRIVIDGGYDEINFCNDFNITTLQEAEAALDNIDPLWGQKLAENPYWAGHEAWIRELAESTVKKFKSGEFPLPSTATANGNTTGRIVGQPPASEKSAEEANPPVKPETSEEEGEGDGWLDGLQARLDVAGLAPGVGAAADVLNAGIHLYRGNYAAAGFALFCAIPGFGDAAAVGKLGLRVVKTAERRLASKAIGDAGTIPLPKPTGNFIPKNKEIDLPIPLISGGIIKGISTPAPGPNGRCQLKSYDDADCGEGMDAHHVTPNRVFQLSSRKANELMPGGVPEGDGLTICLETNKFGADAEHNVAHRYYDAMEKELKLDGITSDGLSTLEQIEDAAAEAIEKATGGGAKKMILRSNCAIITRTNMGLMVKRKSEHQNILMVSSI